MRPAARRPQPATLCLSACLALAALACRSEPLVGGHTRSYWMREASQYSWMPFWNSTKDERRHRAFRELVQIGEPAVPILLDLLRTKKIPASGDALNALGELGPRARSAVPDLARMLDDPDLAVEAAMILARIGPGASPAVPALETALRRGNPAARRTAAGALGAIGASGQAVLEKAAQDPDPAIREAAVTGLAASPRRDLTIDAALQDPDPRVRTGALRSWYPRNRQEMEANVSRLVRAMQDPDPGVRQAARQLFVTVRQNQIVTPAVVAAVLTGGDPESRRDAAWWLGMSSRGPEPFPSEATPALEQALDDPDPTVRIYAVRALGLARPRSGGNAGRLVTVLERALPDAPPSPRVTAGEMLWRLTQRPAPALQAIRDAAASSDPTAKIVALDLALALGDEAAPILPVLASLEQDGDALVRERAKRLRAALERRPGRS